MKLVITQSITTNFSAIFIAVSVFFSLNPNVNASINCIVPTDLIDPMIFDGICPGDSGATLPASPSIGLNSSLPSELNAKGKDVYINLPKDRVCTKHLTISYPNNVRISGGQFTYNDTADAVITIRFTSGTSFIDGLSIDVAGKFSDAIRVHHHTGRLILQNSSVKGITGVPNGFHGDVLHIQGNGPLQELNLQNVTAMTGYHGLFTPYRPQSGDGTRKLRINRINFSYDPGFAQTSGAGKPLMLLYMGSSTDSYDQVPDRGTWLTKTYVDTSYWANINFPYTNAVYARPVGASSGCATFAASDKIRGQVCSGQPAEGDFAPAGKVGLNYDWSYFCKQPPVMP